LTLTRGTAVDARAGAGVQVLQAHPGHAELNLGDIDEEAVSADVITRPRLRDTHMIENVRS
jgi:hypothetical protein